MFQGNQAIFMKKNTILLSLFLFAKAILAQVAEIDELRNVIKSGRLDSISLDKIASNSVAIVDDYPDTTLHYARIGLAMSKKTKQSLFEAKFNKNIGICYDVKGNLDSCLIYLDKAKKIAESINNQFTIANVYSDIAIAYYSRGNYQLSIRNHLECLKIREKLGDKKTIAYALNNLGLAHRARKDYNNALKYYKQSLLLKTANKDSVGIFNTLLNIGSCYQYAFQYDSSYFYANRAKTIAVALKKTQAIEEIDCQIAFALFNLKKIDEAKKILVRYVQLPQSLQTRSTLMGTYQYLGNISIEEKKYLEARNWLQKGIAIAKEGNKLEALAGFYKVLSQCYELEKNYAEALKYQHLHDNAQDTLYNIENARQVNEMNALYEMSEKEKEITQLNAVQNYQLQEIERKQLERNLWLIAALIFLGLAFWTYRSNRIIKQQKEIIQKALDEKEVLNKEIHHRVKNNLQVISGLLSLQSALIKDEQALDAIKESANRVQSMSLIHQQLYQKENITAVNMRNYLLQLIDGIKQTYSNQMVEIDSEVSDIDLDVDTAIPLGLIINELLTNCYKYAFTNIDNPKIELIFKADNQQLTLVVKDNGIGIADDVDLKKSKSFGYKIINAFAKKLNAIVTHHSENGLSVKLAMEIK